MDEHGPDAPDGLTHRERYAFSNPLDAKHPNRWREAKLDAPMSVTRKYLPTLAELIDRLSIVQLKEIYIGGDYANERTLIEHDIDLLLATPGKITAGYLRAVMLIMLANRVIWENEAKAREGGSEQDKLLKFTHSINGIRNRAKNVIARASGEREDKKVDCFAADLPAEYGNWDILK